MKEKSKKKKVVPAKIIPVKKKIDWWLVGMVPCVVILLIIIASRIYAGIRVSDDKDEILQETVRLKFVRVLDGTMFYDDHMDSTFHVGDIYSLDTAGNIVKHQTFYDQKVIVIGRYAEYKYK